MRWTGGGRSARDELLPVHERGGSSDYSRGSSHWALGEARDDARYDGLGRTVWVRRGMAKGDGEVCLVAVANRVSLEDKVARAAELLLIWCSSKRRLVTGAVERQGQGQRGVPGSSGTGGAPAVALDSSGSEHGRPARGQGLALVGSGDPDVGGGARMG